VLYDDFSVAIIPEPGSIALVMGILSLGLLGLRRKFRQVSLAAECT